MSETNPTTGAAPAANSWFSYIKPFADAIGKSPDEIAAALKDQVGEPNDEAVTLLKSEEFVPFEALKSAFATVPAARLKKAVTDHLRSKAASEVSAAPMFSMAASSLSGLPSVPDDSSWLQMLKSGGELKVEPKTVISGVRAALASRLGLFEIPSLLVERMGAQAESLDEPVSAEYYKLRKLLTRRSYAEIFAALEIDGGQYVTQANKSALVRKMDENLWSSLFGFHNLLKGWTESWMQTAANPSMMMAAFASMAAGGRGAGLPPGMIAPPPTDGLRDSAETVINKINRCFSGVGIPVAMAMGYDAQRIKEVLDTPNLPSMVGAVNRDQMLKLLGCEVQADYVRLERNISQYALAVMEYPKVTADAEMGYLTSLINLGSQIPWEKLSATPSRRASAARSSRGLAYESDDEGDDARR